MLEAGHDVEGQHDQAEGIGFSNYASVGPMDRPNFKKASIAVVGEMRVRA